MVATHKPCNSTIRYISVHWHNRQPKFFVNERMCDTCPECYKPLTFQTLENPHVVEVGTPEWLNAIEPVPFEKKGRS